MGEFYQAGSGEDIAGGRWLIPPLPHLGVLSDAIDSMSLGTWLDWTSSTNVQPITDTSGPDGVPTAWLESTGAYFMTNWPGKITFDHSTKQIILVGTAQGFSSEQPPGAHSAAVYLDVTNGRFSKQWNPVGESLAHIYDANVSIALDGKIYRKPLNNVRLFACDLASRAWSFRQDLTALALSSMTNMDVFPEMGAAGSIIFLSNNGKLSRLDLATDARTTLGTYPGTGEYGWIHYVPGGGYVVFGSGNAASSIYKLNADGIVSLITDSLPSGITGSGAGETKPTCSDPSGGKRSWLFSATGLFALDHDTGIWVDHGPLPAATNPVTYPMPPAAIHGYGAFVLLEGKGRANSTTSLSRVWIYKCN